MGDEYTYVSENDTPESNSQEIQREKKIAAYTTPFHASRNPRGNPHGISLPPSISRKTEAESVDEYAARISYAITFALYPQHTDF